MDPRLRTSRRLLPLLAVLAIGTASVLPVAASVPAPASGVGPQPAVVTQSVAGGEEAVSPAARSTPRTNAGKRASTATSPLTLASRVARTEEPAPRLDPSIFVPAKANVPAAPVRTELKAVAPAPSSPRSGGSGSSSGGGSGGSGATYRGTNRVWIPSLGISRSVSWYACSRTSALAHVVYRWGCGGHNNVYLMGHASSVFKPLHDAYVSGRLRKGMKVVYADGNGKVRTYSVVWWRVTPPDGDVAWAYAAQSRPSMTLQTCIGANNQYRLVVRLVAVG